MAKKKTKFVCSSCGYESAKWMGKCPGCNEWNTMVEEVAITGKQPEVHSNTAKGHQRLKN